MRQDGLQRLSGGDTIDSWPYNPYPTEPTFHGPWGMKACFLDIWKKMFYQIKQNTQKETSLPLLQINHAVICSTIITNPSTNKLLLLGSSLKHQAESLLSLYHTLHLCVFSRFPTLTWDIFFLLYLFISSSCFMTKFKSQLQQNNFPKHA